MEKTEKKNEKKKRRENLGDLARTSLRCHLGDGVSEMKPHLAAEF